MATPNNPHAICAWQPVSECAGCSIAGRLKCRFKLGDLLHFMGMFLTFAIPAVIGMIRGGYSRYLLGWAIFCLIFFELWEIRILCSHCPYYAERGTTLHCIANYGSLKVWKYHPEPMGISEKVQLWTGFAILGGYPFPFLILGGQYLWAFVAAWGLAMFFWTLRRDTCSRCVNFSCPLNHVSKEVVDAYLERNPVMRQAWEESGYRIGEAQ
ncbi:MAG: hypothetical protein AB8I69_07255 [Anaerolineae bacterium]|jgi:hypothetical protein